MLSETEIIKKYDGLVKSICEKYPNDMFDDLYQEGCIALIKAYRNYNPNKGASFKTHAYNWIRGYVSHYYRDKASAIRIPRTEFEGGVRKIHITELDKDNDNSNIAYKNNNVVDDVTQYNMIMDILSERVPAMEYRIFRRYYDNHETQDSIALELGISQMQVCRILHKCLNVIKKYYGVL